MHSVPGRLFQRLQVIAPACPTASFWFTQSHRCFAESDRSWLAAMLPLYLAFHNANDVQQIKVEVGPIVSKLKDFLDDSDISMVLSCVTGLPAPVACNLL